jgi:hypothetical protein
LTEIWASIMNKKFDKNFGHLGEAERDGVEGRRK